MAGWTGQGGGRTASPRDGRTDGWMDGVFKLADVRVIDSRFCRPIGGQVAAFAGRRAAATKARRGPLARPGSGQRQRQRQRRAREFII